MSENNKRDNKNKSGAAPMIATIIVALAAIAAIVVLLVMNKTNQGENQSLPDGTIVSFKPSQELADECSVKAHDLVEKSYEIVKLFVVEGLPHLDEPYGNEPEDGIYTVDSKTYTSLEQIEQLVRSVYVDTEADKILHDLDGDGLEVYQNREIEVEAAYSDTTERDERPAFVKKTVLGISADFEPDESAAWTTSRIVVLPLSETQCHLTIYIGADESTDLSSVDSGSVLETEMVNQNGEWRLTSFVY